MIGTITGRVTEKLADSAIVELSGVGYEILLTTSDYRAAKIGGDVKFYIYEHIREDSHTLIGFSSLADKQLFNQLLGVSGIGPKVALSVMSAASPDRLKQAIAAGDASLLAGVSGVGKKTAERIIVELASKVGAPAGLVSSSDSTYQALVGLGYSASQAATAVAELPPDLADEQARIKTALKGLAK
jgi:Holliday junction DNA helicase RuvA